MNSIAVLGGGVGGLSAAHELAERGFSVTVFEQNDRFGGKARSFPGPKDGDTALPAEHGFRFFPGFYQHVTDTMERIPYQEGTVRDNLVETTQILEATDSRRWLIPTAPNTLEENKRTLWSVLGGAEVSLDEKAFFLSRLLQLLSSCDKRWLEFENVNWWEFIKAEQMSPGYQKVLGYGISQMIVAMRPEDASTRSIGRIYLQLIQGLFDETMEADYVLNGPTSEVWIEPWIDYLRNLDVDLRPSATVRAIESDGNRVTGVRIEEGASERTEVADYYVSAMPVGPMERLVTPELERAAPSLGGLSELRTAWMNGIMFYLKRDIPLAGGHSIYYDSPWALTTISQRQFWQNESLSHFQNDVEGVLSICISDWEKPGILYDKPARKCSPEEIKEEVWAQLGLHLNDDEEAILPDDVVFDWFLDPAVEYDPTTGEAHSREPLLINTAGSLQHRPEASTDAENLVLASDYVRTNTDLATMEAANEAARRAVNTILERSGTSASRCTIGDLSYPPPFQLLRRIDAALFQGHLPHPGSLTPSIWNIYNRIS